MLIKSNSRSMPFAKDKLDYLLLSAVTERKLDNYLRVYRDTNISLFSLEDIVMV